MIVSIPSRVVTPKDLLSRSNANIVNLEDVETPLYLDLDNLQRTRLGLWSLASFPLLTFRRRCTSWNFVELVLKICGEERIKVTEGHIVPHSAASMELGRKFLSILRKVPSHTCIAGSLMGPTRPFRTARSCSNRCVHQTSLTWTSFCGTGSIHNSFNRQLQQLPQKYEHLLTQCFI